MARACGGAIGRHASHTRILVGGMPSNAWDVIRAPSTLARGASYRGGSSWIRFWLKALELRWKTRSGWRITSRTATRESPTEARPREPDRLIRSRMPSSATRDLACEGDANWEGRVSTGGTVSSSRNAGAVASVHPGASTSGLPSVVSVASADVERSSVGRLVGVSPSPMRLTSRPTALARGGG